MSEQAETVSVSFYNELLREVGFPMEPSPNVPRFMQIKSELAQLLELEEDDPALLCYTFLEYAIEESERVLNVMGH